MSVTDRPVFRIELRAEPCLSDQDSVRALRAFLKAALRGYRLRCISVVRVPAASKPGSTENASASVLGAENAASTTGEVDA